MYTIINNIYIYLIAEERKAAGCKPLNCITGLDSIYMQPTSFTSDVIYISSPSSRHTFEFHTNWFVSELLYLPRYTSLFTSCLLIECKYSVKCLDLHFCFCLLHRYFDSSCLSHYKGIQITIMISSFINKLKNKNKKNNHRKTIFIIKNHKNSKCLNIFIVYLLLLYNWLFNCIFY